MAKTSGDFEKDFIATVQETTGKTLDQWYAEIKTTGYGKPMEILNWLKETKGMNHLQANLLSGLYLNGGKPVYIDEANLLENQFAKCEAMRPLYEAVAEKITTAICGTQIIPKKTYVSFTANREFAAINIKPKEIRLGMDLGDRPFDETVQKTKLTGPMPRISHMVILTDIVQFDNNIIELLKLSYDRCHKK